MKVLLHKQKTYLKKGNTDLVCVIDMNDFNYFNPTRILFGSKTETYLPKEIKKYGKKVLLHYGGGSIKKFGLYDRIIKLLTEHSIEFIELGGVKPNPVLSMVRVGIEMCKNNNIDFILAVGGGSVIDSAKAIAVGAVVEHDVQEFFKGTEVKNALPIGVVLTIPAAGSESSMFSVITNEDGMLKRGFGSEHIYPKFAILNPENTMSLPDYQTACGLSDMLSHLFERYFTNTSNVTLTSNLLLGAIKTVIDLGPKLMKDTSNYDLRSEVMISGAYAHNGSLGVGREEDWATHGIEHELSGYNDVAHGAGLAVISPAWMTYVSKVREDLFVELFTYIFDIDSTLLKQEIVVEGIEKLKEWYKSLDLPTTLTEIDVPQFEFSNLAKKCIHDIPSGELGYFKKLNKEDIIRILNLAK